MMKKLLTGMACGLLAATSALAHTAAEIGSVRLKGHLGERLDAMVESHVCGAVGTRTVRVSDFGYDPEDSTRFLQAAFDSGADRVIVDRQKGPWIATPLFGRSNQEIVFEDGVELVAKRGEFKGIRDMLISFILTTNVVLRGEGKSGGTLRMWKTDYQDKTQYKPAEWRYTLALYGVLNARVENMSFVSSGGDGICIANRRVDGKACPSRNVIVRNCVSDDNHRQALTVGGARNVLIEDCVFRNTKGTPPEAGVDFEPDHSDEELVNCVMRRCRFENNNGSGIEFYGQQLDETSKPLSMLFEDCTTAGNRQEVCVQCGSSRSNPVKGEVRFRNCTFGNSRGKDKAKIVLMDSSRGYRTVFETCTGVREGEVRQSHPLMDGVVALTGGREPRHASLPPVGRVKAADGRPGEMVELAPCDSVGGGRYVFFAEKGQTAKFRMRQVTAVKGRQASVKPVKIARFSATGVIGKAREFPQPGFEGGEISFEVPARGFYSLRADTDGVRFRLEAANVPVAIDTTEGSRRIVGRDGRTFSLFVRNAGPDAAILGFAGDWYYKFQAAVFDPSGRETWRRALVEAPVALTLPGGKEGLWRVEFSKSEKPVYDWISLAAFDAPVFYFLSSEKTWQN